MYYSATGRSSGGPSSGMPATDAHCPYRFAIEMGVEVIGRCLLHECDKHRAQGGPTPFTPNKPQVSHLKTHLLHDHPRGFREWRTQQHRCTAGHLTSAGTRLHAQKTHAHAPCPSRPRYGIVPNTSSQPVHKLSACVAYLRKISS